MSAITEILERLAGIELTGTPDASGVFIPAEPLPLTRDEERMIEVAMEMWSLSGGNPWERMSRPKPRHRRARVPALTDAT